MYSFEGEFRRKPIQSLGGASKHEQKSSLLQRAQDERAKRDTIRKQNTSATKIQAYYRSAKMREKQKNEIRLYFDTIKKDIQNRRQPPGHHQLSVLLRQIVFFYHDQLDSERLTWLCQILIKHNGLVLENLKQDPETTCQQLAGVLCLCNSHLSQIANKQGQAIAVPLRMLEIFTDLKTYSATLPAYACEQVMHRIYQCLISKGYYAVMRLLVDTKIPPSIEKSSNPPTPVAASLFDLIIKPVTFSSSQKNPILRHVVMTSLCQEFFCVPYTDQVRQFILPALIYGQITFPFSHLLQAVGVCLEASGTANEPKATNQKSSYKQKIIPSLWLLHAILSFADRYIDQITADEINVYLAILQALINQLQPEYHAKNTQDTDSDSEEEYMPYNDLTELQQECVDMLNSPQHVRGIISTMLREPSLHILTGVCKICHLLLSSLKQYVHKTRLLYSLAFNPVFIRSLWHACQTASIISSTGSKSSLLQMLSHGLLPSNKDTVNSIVPLVSTFCSLYNHTLVALDDTEFYAHKVMPTSSTPFTVSEVVTITRYLRDACLGIIQLAYPDSRPTIREDMQVAFRSVGVRDDAITARELEQTQRMWAYLFKVTAHLVKQLYSRDTRRPFCHPGHWLANRVNIVADQSSSQIYKSHDSLTRRRFGELSTLNRREMLDEEGPPMSNTEARNLTILTEIPFVVSFQERVKIFQRLVMKDKEEYQSDLSSMGLGLCIRVMIRRNYIYEDAFDKLSPDNEPNLKLRMQVQLVNVAGLDEAGIDGGGVFREFLSQLLKTGFDPNRGFFMSTADSLLYPNPQARLLVYTFTKHYYFLGRMLGKALYENMLIELPFASFFLSKLLSHHSGDVDIHHLASLDPEMYKNLMYLKNYEGDVSDLDLDFTVVTNDFGETRVEELKSGGRLILVNNDNRIEYVHLMAHYRLNKQIRAHTTAFRQGLADVINLDWLRMFDYNELQVLISGAQVPIDLEDLKQHTNYSGGYTVSHPVIKSFWKVMESFTDDRRRKCLKFVTSCSRPPLLGFKDLFPAFCIHHGGTDLERLPTASTCMNLLKLPEFKDYQTMRTKLLYAIESAAGFELS